MAGTYVKEIIYKNLQGIERRVESRITISVVNKNNNQAEILNGTLKN